MQFAEEFTARRLNAYAEAERAREIELRRVIAERKALAKEQRSAARSARRTSPTTGVVAAPEGSALPETVTVEAILASAPDGGSEAREGLHAIVR